MNRLLLSASRSAAPSLRAAVPPSLAGVRPSLPARLFSDSASSPDPSSSPASDPASDAADPSVRRITGVVQRFSHKESYGFVVPDGSDKDDRSAACFVHRNDLVRGDGWEGEGFYPVLDRGQRVEFRTVPAPEGKRQPRAVEVTLPGGDPIPPFRPGYLKKYVRSQKARFGDVVFEIFATSQDQKELEEKIVAAYDETKRNIDRQTERVARAQAMAERGDEREEARLRDELSGE